MKPISIIGGGLAGLTLGIALRQQNVPVTVIEAGRYPRHRVCGEFISGAGVTVLEQLGLAKMLYELGAVPAHDATFFVSGHQVGGHSLPATAFCVSRYALDAALSRHFQRLGGELREGERYWTPSSAGVVWASGRRPHPVERGWRWFGLKAHAHGVRLGADLEMHVSQNSYVGLCRLPDGEVNVCGLFRRRVGEAGHSESLDLLHGEPRSSLFARLRSAEFDAGSFCAVAGLSLHPQPIDDRECRIGDALTMIPPITGNGMSMAFESAQVALKPLVAYARGEQSWGITTTAIGSSLRAQFSRRLKWAWYLHRMMFFPLPTFSIQPFFRSAFIWRRLFALTR